MDILDFFDINNLEHLQAYRTCKQTGFWPKEFLMNDIIFEDSSWSIILDIRIANSCIDILIDKIANNN